MYTIKHHNIIINRYNELIKQLTQLNCDSLETVILNKNLYLVEIISTKNYSDVIKQIIIKENWFDIESDAKPKLKRCEEHKKVYGGHSLYKFKECLKKFQGRQTCKIPEIIYSELDKKFNSYKLLIPGIEGFVKYSKITKNHVLIFLKELKYAKQYENINLIYYVLTNKKENISHLEPVLIEDFIKILNAYETMVELENLDVNYILIHLLKRHKYNFENDSFHLNKSNRKLRIHNNLCIRLFKLLNWNFNPL
ncbi:Putative replication factor and/or DNA binding/packing protein [Lymphocystis disease virus 1]|uniref:Putative replication factor and/or DNA binding/packing protein n=1 Tax=Fish lymphocystis disease virus TaxID=36363 RepID=UPI0000161EC7|nr:Putative replication factor and/or DNA binding/packing protein [Lymphocystis disease virus 1]